MFLYFNQNVPGKKFAGMEVGKRVQICTHIHEDFYGQYHAPWTLRLKLRMISMNSFFLLDSIRFFFLKMAANLKLLYIAHKNREGDINRHWY